MKLAAFLVGIFAVVSAFEDDESARRKKFKKTTPEPTTTTETTTTEVTTTTSTSTATTTSSTTTTTTTTSEAETTSTTERTFVFEVNEDDALSGGTKELQQILATDNSDDLAIMNGFAFGNGLETKGQSMDGDRVEQEKDVRKKDKQKDKKKDKQKKKEEKRRKKLLKKLACTATSMVEYFDFSDDIYFERQFQGTSSNKQFFELRCIDDNKRKPTYNVIECIPNNDFGGDGVKTITVMNFDFGQTKSKNGEDPEKVREITCVNKDGSTDQSAEEVLEICAENSIENFAKKKLLYSDYNNLQILPGYTFNMYYIACTMINPLNPSQFTGEPMEVICDGKPDAYGHYWKPAPGTTVNHITFTC